MSKLRLTHSGQPEGFQKIPAIKALRQLSGIGLKEAKDAVEAAMLGELVDLSDMMPAESLTSSNEAHRILGEQGFEFVRGSTKTEFIIASIKECAKLATDEEDEELAILLLEVIRQHKENSERKEQEEEVLREFARERNHAERIRKEAMSEIREHQEQRWQVEEKRRKQYEGPARDDRI